MSSVLMLKIATKIVEIDHEVCKLVDVLMVLISFGF